jgi:hypothetical protein
MEDARPFAVKDGVTLWRGFVEQVRWDCAKYNVRGLAPLVAAAPLVQAITLATRWGASSTFYASRELRQIREFYDPEPDGASLAKVRVFDRLVRLELNHAGGPHELRRIVDATWWPRLEAVALSSMGLVPDDMRALVAASPRLRELQLISSRTGRAGGEVLAASPLAPELEILSLRHAKLVVGDVAKLFRPSRWPRLAALDLRTNQLDARDVAALAALPALRVVAVANTKLADAATKAALGRLVDRLGTR